MAIALIAAAVAAATPLPSAPLRDADPAIWVVNDHDTVIFLFGTFHALDGMSSWFNDEIETAFASSDELVLETIVPGHNDPVPAFGAPTTPQRLRSLSVTPSASFLASTRMAISAGRSKGMNVALGADMVLRDAAEASGKSVEGLESFEYQLSMFSRMPAGPAQASPQPGATVENQGAMADLAKVMGDMQAAWNRGDSEVFTNMLEHMRTNAPQSYQVMFTERNRNWANWIAQRMQTPGTVFVAVGAGHLAGRDSVQVKLSQLGIRSARVN